MLRPVLLAASVVALPFAGIALAQEPTAQKGGAVLRASLSGVRITLKNKEEVVGILQLPKGAKGSWIGRSRKTTVVNGTRPTDSTVQIAQAQTVEQRGRTMIMSGDVVLQICQDGKTIMEFKVDEATMVLPAE